MFGERVGLYMWRRDTIVRLRVKILASADRAKAQTAATHRDNSAQGGHLNALSRCHHFFFVSEFRSVFFIRACVETPRRSFHVFFGESACDSTVVTPTGAVRRSWRTAGLDLSFRSTVCSNVSTAPQIQFSPQRTGSRRVTKRIVYTGFSA